MHNIGKSIAEGDYKNADEATVAFVNKISSFAYDNPGMSKYEVDAMTKIAVASVMAHDMADKDFARELKMNLNQYSTEKFDINSETSRIHVLLDAVEKVDYAMKIQGKDRDYNPLKEDLHESMKSSLSKAKTPNERQKFISDIANNLRSDSKQYLLAMEAKQFGVKAEGPDKLKNDYIINDKISRLSERYIISSKTGHNLDSKEIFIGLCDKMPEEKGGAQAVFDKMKDALKDNKDALKMLKQDALEYSAMNKEVGLPVIDVDKKEKASKKTEQVKNLKPKTMEAS